MNISSDLPSPALVRAPAPSPEAREVAGAPDHDGDSDDAGSRASLKSYQGTRVNTSV